MPKRKVTFSSFLLDLRFPYLVGTSFLIFGLIYGAFEIFEYTVNLRLDARTMSYLHFTRGVLTTVALLIWIAWTLYEYRSKFQEVVKQHDDQFVRILDNISEAVVVTDTQHRITFWNIAAADMLGWSREEVLGKSIKTMLRIIPDSGRVQGDNQEQEMDVVDKQGKMRYLAVTTTVLPDENNQPETYTYLMRDLTQRALRQAQMERNERLASLGHMAAGVAHEIGNPLTAISSIIQLLQRRIQDEVQLKQLERVRENIKRITKIVRDLVDFSRPASTETASINVNDPIRDAIGLLRHDARCRKVEFVMELSENLPHVQAVPDQLYQVMLNLMINAVDATSEIDSPKISLKTLVENDAVAIRVEDNGPGIPPAVRDQIFEPFFTTKKVGKGTGLGLAVSHNILSGIGGSIDVDSEPGRTTFTILIPLQA